MIDENNVSREGFNSEAADIRSQPDAASQRAKEALRLVDMAEAMAGIKDGSTVLIGGFGPVGQPDALLEGLIEQGAKDLVCVANNAGTGHVGLPADGTAPGPQDHLQLPAQRRVHGVREPL